MKDYNMKCNEKEKYNYYVEAGYTASHLKKRGTYKYIYLCDECNGFHLTSNPPNPQDPRRLTIKDYKKMGIYERKR